MSPERPKKLPKRGTPRRRQRMRAMVHSLLQYVASYSGQAEYDDYSDETFLDDMLYGIGLAFDPDAHKAADGYARWKEKLREHLSPADLGSAGK